MTDEARIVSLLDLTSLEDDEDEARITALLESAVTPIGPVAAVCLWPRWVPRASAVLTGTGVRVATVANFPAGGLGDPGDEIRAAVDAGADEVDVVLPWRAVLEGDDAAALRCVEQARAACRVTLKVILETGSLPIERIEGVAAAVLATGADMVKTSTGKHGPGASPEAVEAMLRAVGAAGRDRHGVKVSGGVRTPEQARAYLAQADRVLGPGWARPRTFRFGASSLLAALLP